VCRSAHVDTWDLTGFSLPLILLMCLDANTFSSLKFLRTSHCIIGVLASILQMAGALKNGRTITVTPLLSQTNVTASLPSTTKHIVNMHREYVCNQLLHASMLHLLGLTSPAKPLFVALAAGRSDFSFVTAQHWTWQRHLGRLTELEFSNRHGFAEHMKIIDVAGKVYLCEKGGRCAFLGVDIRTVDTRMLVTVESTRMLVMSGRLPTRTVMEQVCG
jgi:hypothetical protein